MTGLLFISHQTDRHTYLQSIEMALEGGCRQIQLRMKDASQAELEEAGRKAKALCRSYGATLYIDDHAEVCRSIGADGLHLGKQDMPLPEARRLLGRDYIIGGTANSLADIQRLKTQGADYIGLGPYRFTTTKKNLSPVLGPDGYRKIMQACRREHIGLPVLAIGGITPPDIPDLLAAGVSGIALSSAILQAKDPVEETKKIIQIINTYRQ